MESILTLLTLIDWLCNDVHYAAGGCKNFYARHLLSDRVRDFGSAEDDIKELYYLGFKNELPPKDAIIAKYASELYDGILSDPLSALVEFFGLLVSEIDSVKKSDMPAGVHAVLDNVSEKALAYKFLCSKECLNEESSSKD